MDDSYFFGTCCDDGSVKLWNIQKIEKPTQGKQKITYSKQGGVDHQDVEVVRISQCVCC